MNGVRYLRDAVDLAADAMFVHTAEGRIVDCNRMACESLGYTCDELLRMHVSDIDLNYTREKIRLICTNLNPEDVKVVESVHKRKNGTTFPVEVRVRLVDASGPKRIIAVAREITERKLAESELQRSQALVRDIIDNVDEAILLIDPQFRIMTANRAYCEAFGLTLNDVLGKYCYEVTHHLARPCHLEGRACSVAEVFATGIPTSVMFKAESERGNWNYVEKKAFPVKDASGRVTAVIETARDMTEHHLLEAERVKTQKLEAIGTLAGGIAHDFNNLLQGVFGYISMAKHAVSAPEKVFPMLEQAEKALHQSVSLATQLLTFAKGGKPVKKPVALLPIIEDSARFALSGSCVECRVEVSDDLWCVYADEGQMGQVLQNLVVNADQAMPEGGSIVITAKNVEGMSQMLTSEPVFGRYVEITVEDRGIGITQENLSKIFDPYFTTKEKGSGLGLTTAYSIIKNHEGAIRVASEPGKGTAVVISLPACDPAEEAAEAESLPRGSRKGKVLVMDDEDIVLQIVNEMMQALGHDVEFADRGEVALEKYREARDGGRPFDLVILDLTIRGGMGGIDTLRELKSLDPDVRAVVSSGYSDDEVVSDYQAHGFAACLSKPYDLDALNAVMNALLG